MSSQAAARTEPRPAGRLSPKTNRARRAVLAIAALGWLSLPAAAARPEPRPDSSKAECWILMDIAALQCAACLEPLLAFCRALPVRIQEEQVLGVLVDGGAGGATKPELRSFILLKKWEGLRRANGIRIPAVFDADAIFRSLLNGRVVVLLVNETRRVLTGFCLPLKPGQMDEIISLLAGGPG